jgi:hypothetical protein
LAQLAVVTCIGWVLFRCGVAQADKFSIDEGTIREIDVAEKAVILVGLGFILL